MEQTANLPKEIERKFLLKNQLTPELIECWREKSTITQGYLSVDENKVVRIRVALSPMGGKIGYLTVKGKSDTVDNISRTEIETQIGADVAEQLLSAFCTKVIKKTRYYIRVCGNLWEIDQFHDKNEGLWLAEIELNSQDQEFTKPTFVGEEVTHDLKYTNVSLADHPFKDW